jgi:hypothetical protein
MPAQIDTCGRIVEQFKQPLSLESLPHRVRDEFAPFSLANEVVDLPDKVVRKYYVCAHLVPYALP